MVESNIRFLTNHLPTLFADLSEYHLPSFRQPNLSSLTLKSCLLSWSQVDLAATTFPTSIRRVDISNNPLHEFSPSEEAVSRLSAISRLDLSSAQLSSLGGAIQRLSSLAYLYAGGNGLTGVDLTAMTSLRELHVDSNSLTSVGPLPRGLRVLDADDNKIQRLVFESGQDAIRLQKLSLRFNQLTSLDVLASLSG